MKKAGTLAGVYTHTSSLENNKNVIKKIQDRNTSLVSILDTS